MLLRFAVLFILTLSNVSLAVDMKMLKEKESLFWQKTNLKSGDYLLKSGPKSCMRGVLKTAIHDDKDFTLMLGARGLVLGLGSETEKKKQQTTKEKCEIQFKSEFENGRIRGEITDPCGKEKVVRRVEVTPQDNGFRYHRMIFEGGKVVLDETCDLELADSPN